MSHRTWFSYWRENMQDLGIPIPNTWHGSEASVLALAGALANAVEKYGSRVTVAELVGAGAVSEQVGFFGALTAAGVAGAAIGSAAVATGRYIAGGTLLADLLGNVLGYAARRRVLTREVHITLARYPQIYNQKSRGRKAYAQLIRYAGQ
jgi:hypothetical protein